MSNFQIVYNAFYNSKSKVGHTNAIWYQDDRFKGELFYEHDKRDTYFHNWICGLSYGISVLMPSIKPEPTHIDFIIASQNFGSSIANVNSFFDLSFRLAHGFQMMRPELITDQIIRDKITSHLQYKKVTYMEQRVMIIKQILDIKQICKKLSFSLDTRVSPHEPVDLVIDLMHEHIKPTKKTHYEFDINS